MQRTGKAWKFATGVVLLGALIAIPSVRSEAEAIARTARIQWEARQDGSTRTLTSFGGVIALALSPDGKTLISGFECSDRGCPGYTHNNGYTGIEVWNLQAGKRVGVPLPLSRKSYSIAITSAGQIVDSGGTDAGRVKIWNLDTRQLIRQVSAYSSNNRNFSSLSSLEVAVTPDEKTLITGSPDGVIKLWDLRTGSLIRILERSRPVVARGYDAVLSHQIAISPDSRIIASTVFNSTDSSSVSLWDLRSGELLRTLQGRAESGYLSVALSNDRLVAGSYHGAIDVWRTDTGEQVHALTTSNMELGLAVSPNGRRFASSNFRGITLRAMDSGQIVRTFEPRSSALRLVFHPDGKTLVSAQEDGAIKFWSLP